MTLRYLFFDLNAYFASVEQQCCPELRGKPVAVAPSAVDTTCCIAASYEAKAFGIKTGTAVWKAKQLCPGIHIQVARPELYVRFHHRIMDAVENCLPIDTIYSIDEAACRLIGDECRTENAVGIAAEIKNALKKHIGEYVKCSIGLAPNYLLAKIASDMKKPDGLTIIHHHELPEKLLPLQLTDIPGIGTKMAIRLKRHGIHTIRKLCELTEDQMAHAWGSVVGRWFHLALHGHDLPPPTTHRRTVGHSHVLPPAWRSEQGAFAVLTRLIHKAAVRLRRMDYWTRQMHIYLGYFNQPAWNVHVNFPPCQDTLTLLREFNRLWKNHPPRQMPMKVAVTLSQLVPPDSATLPLFQPSRNWRNLASAMDRINTRYGPHTLYFAGMFNAKSTAPMRISFTNIPNPNLEL